MSSYAKITLKRYMLKNRNIKSISVTKAIEYIKYVTY